MSGGAGLEMFNELKRAEHYREQAKRLREMAEQDTNPETRKALLSVAKRYDGLSAALKKRVGLKEANEKSKRARLKKSGVN